MLVYFVDSFKLSTKYFNKGDFWKFCLFFNKFLLIVTIVTI